MLSIDSKQKQNVYNKQLEHKAGKDSVRSNQ